MGESLSKRKSDPVPAAPVSARASRSPPAPAPVTDKGRPRARTTGAETLSAVPPVDLGRYELAAKEGEHPTVKDPKSIRILGMRFLDPSTSACTLCKSSFTTTNRRHWCRRCGRIFCDTCTTKRQQLYTGGPLLRVCNTCATPTLFQLPISLLQHIFSYFDERTLARALGSCHRFQLGINLPYREIRNIHDHYNKKSTKYIQKGAFGSVYSTTHLKTLKPAAIKVIDKYHVHTLREWAFIRREVDLHRKLDHPNIVKLEHVYQTRSKVYIVMELGGGDLFDYILKKGFMTEKEVIAIAVQLLHALDYLHNIAHVVHRDIKLENILVFTTTGDDADHSTVAVKLCDFGLAKSFPPSEEPSKVSCTPCGTLNYCPPEVLSKTTKTTTDRLTKLDIFSLGIVLHVLISGVEPFQGKGPSELLRKMQKPLRPSGPEWANISETTLKLVVSMLNFHSQYRPTASEALYMLGAESFIQLQPSPLLISPSPQIPLTPKLEGNLHRSEAVPMPNGNMPILESQTYQNRVAASIRKEWEFRFEEDEEKGMVVDKVQRYPRLPPGSNDQTAEWMAVVDIECLAENTETDSPAASPKEPEIEVDVPVPRSRSYSDTGFGGDAAYLRDRDSSRQGDMQRSAAIPMATRPQF